MRIPTGGMLPAGADAVVMVEHTARSRRRHRRDRRAATRGQHVMRRGEDARKGTRLFARGHRVRPADVGALSGSASRASRSCSRPRVAVLATGDEIVAARRDAASGTGAERQPVRAPRVDHRGRRRAGRLRRAARPRARDPRRHAEGAPHRRRGADLRRQLGRHEGPDARRRRGDAERTHPRPRHPREAGKAHADRACGGKAGDRASRQSRPRRS